MSKIIQRCPTDSKKLLNPETGRCVIETNATIKRLLKEGWTIVITNNMEQPEPPPSSGVKVFKVCPTDPNKLVNPETGRCVKHNNPTIKKLVREGWIIAINSARTLPVIVKKNGNLTNWKKLKSYLDKNKDSLISIDEYLGTREITPEEEKPSQPIGKFSSLYKSENIVLFLEKEIKKNPILQKTTCLNDDNDIILGFGRFNVLLPEYVVGTKTSISTIRRDYRHIYILATATVLMVPTEINNTIRNLSSIQVILPPNLKLNLNSCKTRYYVLPLTITNMNMYQFVGLSPSPDKISHANVLIFDTLNQTVERFDPHGSSFFNDTFLSKDIKAKKISATPTYHQEILDGVMRYYFEQNLPDYTYKNILYTCPYLGPQQKADVGDGYCVTWTVMYTFLRLLNPDLPPGTINRMLLNDKEENIVTKLKKFAKYYSDVIKS